MSPAGILTSTYHVFDKLKIIMMRNSHMAHVVLVYVIETFLLEFAKYD